MDNTNTIAARIIAFLAGLHGFDECPAPMGTAAIDLQTGLIVRPSADFPDGEALILEYAAGANPGRVPVNTHKLMESYLLRHARAVADTDGDSVAACFEHISAHFTRKTGYGQ